MLSSSFHQVKTLADRFIAYDVVLLLFYIYHKHETATTGNSQVLAWQPEGFLLNITWDQVV